MAATRTDASLTIVCAFSKEAAQITRSPEALRITLCRRYCETQPFRKSQVFTAWVNST
jgi:hypothetical protein